MLGEFLGREVEIGGGVHKFAVYVPPNHAPGSPAIMFLHGMGESGTDGASQTTVGLGSAIRANPERWPFLVVFPQKPEFGILWPDYVPMLEAILKLIDAEFAPAPSRRYLTGISQGGNGTIELARLSWRFAAIAPICGWADPRAAAATMKTIPTWIFHGDADPAVPVSSSVAINDWCKRFEADQKISIYPGVDHNSWDMAYAEALPEWFLQHGGLA